MCLTEPFKGNQILSVPNLSQPVISAEPRYWSELRIFWHIVLLHFVV